MKTTKAIASAVAAVLVCTIAMQVLDWAEQRFESDVVGIGCIAFIGIAVLYRLWESYFKKGAV